MIGPRGSLVTLTFKRQVHGSGEFSEYTIELMRGDSLYFLQVENQVAESKLEIFRSNINEVKVEMDNMRTVLAQAQGRVKMTESEVQTMQTRYRQMQNAIEKCIGDIADERQMQANLRDNLQRSESETPYKEQLGAYHEKLMRVEATLGEIMSELAGEHEASCTLLTELDQEQRIAKLIAEKIRNHEGLVARSSEHTTSIEDVIAQRYGEMEHLRNQIAETQAEATRIEQEFETELADSNATQAKVALAQVLSFWRCNERFCSGGLQGSESELMSAL
jgi:chromosome segregation ATPase